MIGDCFIMCVLRALRAKCMCIYLCIGCLFVVTMRPLCLPLPDQVLSRRHSFRLGNTLQLQIRSVALAQFESTQLHAAVLLVD